MFFIPGLIAYAMSKSGQLNYQSSDQVFPTLVRELLPSGVRGLVAGGLIAALMSSLSSVFNSCSTLFTIDIYKKLKPNTSEKKLVFVGRVATAVVVITGILWIPLIKVVSSGGLYTYIQSVQAYIAPPIAAVFLLGLFWSRINSSGALAALIGGFSAGMIRLGLEINKANLADGIWLSIAELNFLYFAIFSFLSCIAILIIVSILTPAPDYDKLEGLTYETTLSTDKENSKNSWNNIDVLNSAIIIAIVLMILLYFSPIGIGG
jgi:SSS family solute:Na+ symporter